jgi:hypothetical protein
MIKNEIVLNNVLGFFPTYMRPPYSSCSYKSGCLKDMEELGYHVTYYDVDTDDYNNDSPDKIQRSKDLLDGAIAAREGSGKPMLVIAHDVHEQTVYNLTNYMLHALYAADYHPVTLGECLGDPEYNWYRRMDYVEGSSKGGSKPVTGSDVPSGNTTCKGSGDCFKGIEGCGCESPVGGQGLPLNSAAPESSGVVGEENEVHGG